MSRPDTDTQINLVRLLSFALAFLLWLSLFLERPGKLSLSVPVAVERIPAGEVLASPPPSAIDIAVSGPRIALLRLKMGAPVVCRVDLADAPPGVITFAAPERLVSLGRDLKVEKVYPGSFSLTLKKSERK